MGDTPRFGIGVVKHTNFKMAITYIYCLVVHAHMNL